MDSKTHTMIIQKKEPLEKWEMAMMDVMTWDEAIKKTSAFLSPAIVKDGTGTAYSVRIARYGKNDWVYIPQWDY